MRLCDEHLTDCTRTDRGTPQNQNLKIYIIVCSIIQLYTIVTLNKLQLETVTFFDCKEKTTSYRDSFRKEILQLRKLLSPEKLH